MAVAALILASGCGDHVEQATAPDLRIIDPPAWSTPLAREATLAAPATASVTVDADGGALVLAETGLEVVIPAGAVRRSTTITVTAVPGTGHVYAFAPHGLRFRVPLVVTQRLPGVHAGRAGALALSAGYFDGVSAIDAGTGRVLVSEILPVTVDVARNAASFKVSHFSGYMVASGRKDKNTTTDQ
jgi:hypothetical protein